MAKGNVKPIRDEGKVRFELRFDEDLYAAMKRLADEADISVNQLMQGITRWAVANGHAGEPDMQTEPFFSVTNRPQAGCVWFGKQDSDLNPQDERDECHGHVDFCLDFTERRVLRDSWNELRKGSK